MRRQMLGGLLLALLVLPTFALAQTALPSTSPATWSAAVTTLAVRSTSDAYLAPDGTQVLTLDSTQACVLPVTLRAGTANVQAAAARCTPHPGALRIDPLSVAWSPDSQAVVMTSRAFVDLFDSDIWLLDVVMMAYRNLTDDGYEGHIPLRDAMDASTPLTVDVAPAWLDAETVVFVRYNVPPSAEELLLSDRPLPTIMRVLADGSAPAQVVLGPVSRDTFSVGVLAAAPGSNTVAFLRSYPAETAEVQVLDVASGAVRTVTSVPSRDTLAVPTQLAFTPDGAELLLAYGWRAAASAVPSDALIVRVPVDAPRRTAPSEVVAGQAVFGVAYAPDASVVVTITRGLQNAENGLFVTEVPASGPPELLLAGIFAPPQTYAGHMLMTWAANDTLLLRDAERNWLLITLSRA